MYGLCRKLNKGWIFGFVLDRTEFGVWSLGITADDLSVLHTYVHMYMVVEQERGTYAEGGWIVTSSMTEAFKRK